MSEKTVKVTGKGQVTIPASYRKKLRIRRGTKLIVSQSENLIILKPLPEIEDLAGVHAGEVSMVELGKELDEMRRMETFRERPKRILRTEKFVPLDEV